MSRPRVSKEKYQNPLESKLQWVSEFRDTFAPHVSDRQLFEHVGIARTTGQRLLRKAVEPPTPRSKETRGRKPKLSNSEIRAMIEVIEYGDIDGRIPADWGQLRIAANIETAVCASTIKKELESRGYERCAGCLKRLMSPLAEDIRIELAKIHLSKDEEWHKRVRFSDIVHFSLSPTSKMKIRHERGRRYHPECTERSTWLTKRGNSRPMQLHCWAMVGWNYKSPLYFWPKARKGKLDGEGYMQIHRETIHPAFEEMPQMILQEYNDTSLDETKWAEGMDLALLYKRQIRLECLPHIPHSPDTSPVEILLYVIQQNLESHIWPNDELLKEDVLREWENLSFETINDYCGEGVMKDRARQILDWEEE